VTTIEQAASRTEGEKEISRLLVFATATTEPGRDQPAPCITRQACRPALAGGQPQKKLASVPVRATVTVMILALHCWTPPDLGMMSKSQESPLAEVTSPFHGA